MKTVTVIYLFAAVLSANFVMAQKYETQPFESLNQYDEAELRFYPTVMKIQSNGDFGPLFRYISGANAAGEKIAMTTPVQMGNTQGDEVMQFVLPSAYTKENTPPANSESVTVMESESGHYLAIKYGGYTMEWRENKAALKLRGIAERYGFQIEGDPIVMVYNSPYQVFNRKNEVLYKVVMPQ
jgi:hypothetical protein